MSLDYVMMKSVIEGLLFVSGDEGLDAKQIAEVLDIDQETVVDLIYDMMADFKREGRGIQIVEVAKSFQLTTLPSHAPYFAKLAHSPQQSTLSQAAIETLSIIAYKQPITRSEIEEIRGVKSEKAIQTLINKGLIKEVGRLEGTGRPILFGTTKAFLEHFGLQSLDDLPPLPEGINANEMLLESKSLFPVENVTNMDESNTNEAKE